MLLIKRVCQTLRRPVFEVMQFPASELEHWSIFFNIDDHAGDPVAPDPDKVDVEQCVKSFKEQWS